MLIKTIPVGQLETNCYVVSDEESLDCAVIDPGDESNAILDYLEDNHLKCRAILITHGHYDHVGAVLPVREETGAPVYIHALDSGDSYEGGRKFPLPEGGKYYDEGDEVVIGALKFRVLHTPGHTPGGVTLLCGDAMFCGDTLFAGSCGRTDLPGGDMDEELRSLKKLCSLPGDYEVYPGHMDSTTLAREREYNYYCRQAMGKV
jgi:glyoxylase-like metal-dependent hydrolase (beta-lactamase superfamily II)